MPRLPRVSGAQVVRALEHLGFVKARQSGSHVVLRRGAVGCVVPLHPKLRLARSLERYDKRKSRTKSSQLRFIELVLALHRHQALTGKSTPNASVIATR